MRGTQSRFPTWSVQLRLYAAFILGILMLLAVWLVYSIFAEQENIGRIGRYNLTWVISQAAHETLRLQEVMEAYTLPNSPVALDDVILRLQVLENRTTILTRGEVGRFIESNDDFMETVSQLRALLPHIETRLTLTFDGAMAVELRALLEPYISKMLALAASAHTWSADKVAEDQKGLSLLHWSLTVLLLILIVIMFSGVYLILKWDQNHIDLLNKAKNEAEEADKAKTNFLAQMSHELRTPLNAVIGFSEMIEMGLAGPTGSAKQVEYISDIKKSGQHLLELVNDLLDLARMRSGALDLVLAPIDIRDCLAESVNLVKPKSIDKNVEIVTTPSQGPWVAIADQRGVQQVLINLLFNSIKFSPSGSVIDVSAQPLDDGRRLKISIRDYGPGLSDAILAQIGKPFIDRGSTLVAHTEGTGLGLAIVMELIQAMNGEFRIANAPEGGALAEFVLATQPATSDESRIK